MKEDIKIKTNSHKAWLLAARPKTLTGAAVPVMMALSLAFADSSNAMPFRILPALLCLLFAFVMQIDANFINDYVDFRKGADDEYRLGPRRACAQGWVTEKVMKRAILLTTALACTIGFPLVCYGGWEMVVVGMLCVVFCFLYTTHLSYLGLGDILVLVFFGIVPVCITYYLQMHTVTREVFLSSLACGMVIDTLLIVNNYRDCGNDRKAGKMTLVVRIGKPWTEWIYFILGLLACHMGLVFFFEGRYFTFFLPFVYLALHADTWRKMKHIKHGKALNLILSENARNMFLYGLLFSTGVVIDHFVF